ncbi:histidinol-phosphate transaminase [Pelomicrobium methylotrophicum]|uniref:Histidinol-phosphate aminotransferase n=1 Tax=Pelomicrobium methylotrophicum TaxID=2602750 RepID=A0A5C7EM55_9PROT|nr:histidinol-phosphate transaminase [Pelomicrobium methylotrophicum]TXF12493.1 histidinol-phosphate transaminase [Pelomicrobium methylotrophicum]
MDVCDLSPGYVRAIAPYQPGKPISELERELGLTEIVKLASNENPLGPSPKALAAIQKALPELARYPDGNGFELKAAICRKFNVTMDQVVLGNGSNDVLEMVARAFLAPGIAAVYSQHAFAVYPLAVQAIGAKGIEVPARNYGHDLEAMLEAIDEDTRIVFIANPNNPTGTVVQPAQLLGFLRRVPRTVVVVLDEAYYEYLPQDMKSASPAWIGEFPNLVVTRTFSKAYGLAALRVGFALAQPRIAELMNRVRQPFNVNTLGQVAATAALDDAEFVAKSVALNRAGMMQITTGLIELKLPFIPSYGNFVCFEVGDANAVFQKLLRKGVIVRPVANYGLPQHLRVSVGLESENARFLAALREVLAA